METVGKELLTKLQDAHQGASLYQLHKILGVSTQAIYQIYDGSQSMGADTILICCDVLGLDPQPWLLRAEIARCKSPKRRQILIDMLERYGTAPALALLALLPFLPVSFPGLSTI